MKVKLLKQFGIHAQGTEIDANMLLAKHLAKGGYIDLNLEKLEEDAEKAAAKAAEKAKKEAEKAAKDAEK